MIGAQARQPSGHVMQTQETHFDRHYSIDELAAIRGVSDDLVRRLLLPADQRGTFGHPR